MIAFSHNPVLWQEAMDVLDLAPGHRVVDCTVGGGGHSRYILERILPSGFLVGIDQDHMALEAAQEHLASVAKAIAGQAEGAQAYVLVHRNFSRIKEILSELAIAAPDRALMDLGVSSFQLDEGLRGFSYQHTGELDMRMDSLSDGPTAQEVLMSASKEELEQILWRYGEERWGRRIARFIVEEREKAPIKTTSDLVRVIKKAVPRGAREDGPHPARRSFQALRIHVNRELEILEQAICDMVDVLAPRGILAVIGFHSLEDRIVKDTFKKLATGCVCPKHLPVCACGRTALGKVLTPKPIQPGAKEIEDNPRSRSAKLRAFQKI